MDVCLSVCLQDSDSPVISLSDLRSLSDSDLSAELTSALRRSVTLSLSFVEYHIWSSGFYGSYSLIYDDEILMLVM